MPQQNRTPLQNLILKTALNSHEFLDTLNITANEIIVEAKDNSTEATISGHFERTLYSVLRDIGISFIPQKEVAVAYNRHIGNGRLDSRLGAVVIEYKRPATFNTDIKIQTAVDQLKNYLIELSTQNENQLYGFLTDGRKYIEIQIINGEFYQETKAADLSGKALLNLTKSIYALQLTALTANNLIRDFCENTEYGELFNASRVLNQVLTTQPTAKTDMLFSEWKSMFSLGHDDKSQQKRIQDRRKNLESIFNTKINNSDKEYKSLFALHTAYAILIKLMAYRVVSELNLGRVLSKWSDFINADDLPIMTFCSRLEDGEIFRNIGILNLLEGDFFSWYADGSQWNTQIADVIRTYFQILGRYEQSGSLFEASGAIDLFKELYEATVPQTVRSSFGEFYTPLWLGQHVIKSAELTGKWRLLDPCCGSGTFVVTAIEIIRNEDFDSDEVKLEAILSRVYGIDLNPLAVLTSRVNYFIHISDLIPDQIERLLIPVFLGDASNVPIRSDVNGVECIGYRLETLRNPITVNLPASLATNTELFSEIMLKYEKLIQNEDEEGAIDFLTSKVQPNDLNEIVKLNIKNLSSQLVSLEKNGWNGVWARILSNFLATASIGKFDLIVGNPPWVEWKNLPEGYREKIKSLAIDKGLFSGDGRTGGINLNVCALISHVSMSNWLSDNGLLAFLMPKELTVQQSYEGWRTLPGNENWNFIKFYDWTESGHPFDPVKEDFMTYLIGEVENKEYIPVISIIKNRGDRTNSKDWENLDVAESHFSIKESVAGQITPNSTMFSFSDNIQNLEKFKLISGSSFYIGREGIEFFPQELQLFYFEKNGPIPGTAYVRNYQSTRSKYPIPQQTKLLETKFLFPLAKGPSIKPFHYENPNLIVAFPYYASDPYHPITRDILERESPLLLQHYDDFEKIIRSQTEFSDKIRGKNPGEYYGLARTGPYSFADIHVGYRDNTKWHSVVIAEEQMPWGENKRYLFQNHAVSMCEREDGSFINLDEAHYICAILNSPIVKEFINSSSDNRSFKIRPPVYIPKYDKSNKHHEALMILSKKAHENSNNDEIVEECLESINENYLIMCLQRQP